MILQKHVPTEAYYAALLILSFVLLGVFIPENFLSKYNIQSMAFQIPEFGILAMGMMVTIITGGIDLSIISNAVLSAVFASLSLYFCTERGFLSGDVPIFLLLFAVCVVSGVIFGLINGLLIARLKIPAILATLGTMKFLDGIGTVITGGQPLRNYPDVVAKLANETLLEIPYSFLLFVVVVIVMVVLLERSSLGFRLYMFGENPTAARYSGIRNSRIIIAAYGISGFMAGLSGLIMMSRFNSIKVGYGVSYQLLTILVAILGGVAPAGGKGKVLNVIFGVFILQCIASGFNILGFSNYIRNVIYGVVLIIVMIVNFVFLLAKNRREIRKLSA
jgi:simple sugar transport system permease protein